MKTKDLSGTALNWAVAHCGGKGLHYFADDWFKKDPWLSVNGEADQPLHSYTPSTTWGQGGPIIEQEQIALFLSGDDEWTAEDGWHRAKGETPLIAAMRCYVASKLGDEVEIPKELLTSCEEVA